jgi:hypothetical protein
MSGNQDILQKKLSIIQEDFDAQKSNVLLETFALEI